MAEIIYPLNEVDYEAEDAQLWNSGIARGVFGNSDFTIEEIDGLTVTIGKGRAWLKPDDFTGFPYANKSSKTLTFGLADSVADRYDVVAIRWDNITNSFEALQVITGGTTIPTPTQTESEQELYLYAFKRTAGSTEITAADVTELRTDITYCGLVTSAFSEVDTAVVNAKMNAVLDAFEASGTQSLADLQAAIDSIVAGSSTMLKEEYAGSADGVVAQADNATNGIQTYTHEGYHEGGGLVSSTDGEITQTVLWDAGEIFEGNGENGKVKAAYDVTLSNVLVPYLIGTSTVYKQYAVVYGSDDTEIELTEGRWYSFILDEDASTINFSSGGVALNYKIVASATEPTDPAEGTIWIESDTEVGKVQIGAEKPTTRANGTDLQDGDVFLQTGGSEYTEITISDGLGVSILSVSQWSSETESWLYVVGYVRKNETWQSLLYAMYYGGVDYVLFGDDFSSDKSVTAVGSSSGNSASSSYMSEQLVDLTNLSTLYFQYSGFRGSSTLTTTSARVTVKTDELTSAQTTTTGTSSLSNTISLDVSSATGLQLVGFSLVATTSTTTASTAYITPIAFWGI